MDLEEVVDGAEEVVEEVDGAKGEVRLPPVHGHALAWLGRLAPRLELRRAEPGGARDRWPLDSLLDALGPGAAGGCR